MLVLAIATLPVNSAQAERRGGFFSNLFGNGQQNRTTSHQSSAQRQANKAVQTALNFFAFDAGAVDGILGRRSRDAIKRFQTLLAYEPTGRLSAEQRQLLLSAYEQASTPDEALQQQLSAGVIAPADLLRAVKQGEPLSAALPAVLAGPRSMRDLCVNIQAAAPLDLVKAQFCNLRQLAIEHGDFLLETALNTDMLAPVVSGCQVLTTEMQPRFSTLANQPPDEALSDLALLIESTQTNGEKLSRQAETCLGLAYQHDDSDAAFAALLLLAGLKDAVYIEQTGYHIAFGLGTESPNPAQAGAWAAAALGNLPDAPESTVSLTSQSAAERGKVLTDVAGILEAYR